MIEQTLLAEDDGETHRDSCKRSCRKRSFQFQQWASLFVVAAAIAALLVPSQVDGLTPSKPNKPTSSHSNRSKKLSASNLSLERVATRNERQTIHTSANKKRNHHNRGGQQQQQKQQLSRSQAEASIPIFVKNLHYEATKNDIVQACRNFYGDVESVWVPQGNDKKGYASVVFKNTKAAHRALANGRLKVLGRWSYLVEDKRPSDPKGDAFRFLAALGDESNLSPHSRSRVLKAVDNAGTPRSEKERGILAASLARIGARDELLKVLQWKNNHSDIVSYSGTSVYNAALSALTVSNSRECKLAKEIVAMAEKGPGVNARTYATAIGSIKRGASEAVVDLSKTASHFLETAVDRGVANHVVYNELISCLSKTSGWKMATKVLDRMFEDDGVEPTEVSLNSAIASCASAGKIDAAKKIYEESFQRANIQPTIVTTNSLVSTAHRWIKRRRSEARDSGSLDPSDAKRAIDFVRGVVSDAKERGDKLDLVSINTLVSAYGAAGDVRSAMKLFRNAYIQGMATTVTANAALSALAVSGEVSKASYLVHELKNLKIRSDITSWNTAISACGVSDCDDNFETASKLFEEMPFAPDAHSFASVLSAVTDQGSGSDGSRASGSATSKSVNDILKKADTAKATTTFVMNAALAAYDRLADSSSFRLLFEDGFKQRGLAPDVVSYNTAIHSLGRDDPVVAVEIFSRMIEETALVEPDEQSYCAVISGLANSGLHKEALKILQSCPSYLQKSLAMHNEALRAYYGAAEPEAALQLFREMRLNGPKPNLVSTTIVMNTCAKAGREYEAGFSLFEDAQSPDLIAFNSAITLAEKSGDADRAISLLSRLVRADGDAPDAVSFCSAIAACERSQGKDGNNTPRFRTALRLLKESIKAVGPNAACYIATVQTLAAAGELYRALELLDNDCVASFDSQSRYVLYRTVQVGCAATGDSITSDRLGREISDQNLKPLAALATARVGGCVRNFDNKIDSKYSVDGGAPLVDSVDRGEGHDATSMADIANTVQDLVRKMDHKFVTSALPIEFQAHSTQSGQEISLMNHAEKKALAQLLLDETRNPQDRPSFASLSVEINFKMCADCHAYFKGASALLGRRITVKEPTMLHVFVDGECSCNNSWRWEERHAFEHATTAFGRNNDAKGGAARHRFGRLPPLLKP
jgi:pentatricopeptide repeat protein